LTTDGKENAYFLLFSVQEHFCCEYSWEYGTLVNRETLFCNSRAC